MEYHYTPEQIAEKLQVHVKTVYNWIREGRLSAVKLGKRTVRIPESELQRFLAENRGPLSSVDFTRE